MGSNLGRRSPRYASALAGVALCLALAATIPHAGATETDSTQTVRSLYSTLLAVMRNGPLLGVHGRYAQLEPVVRRVFDISLMTRLAVGPDWAALPEPQRQRLSEAFSRYVTAIYAERFESYSGQQLEVTGVEGRADGTIVTSRIVKANGQPVTINYLLHDNGGAWQIMDVYFDGTISELANHRSEFASILRKGGVDELIQTLDRKADSLGAS